MTQLRSRFMRTSHASKPLVPLSRVLTIVLAAAVLSSGLADMRSSSAAPAPWAVATSILKAVGKYFGKEGTEEAAEYLAQKGGRELVERVASTAAKEGGEEAVEQVAKLTAKYGPEALSALDNTPAVKPLIEAIEQLTEAEAKSAIARLAAGATGRELAETVVREGASALVSEVAHPGIGGALVRALGSEAGELTTKLTSKQALTIGRHADELAKLPKAQKSGLLALLKNDTDRMVKFMGRFVEANPGKTLFTVATTTVILAEPERILGGDEIVFDAEGNPIVVTRSGIAGRSIEATGKAAGHISANYIKPLFLAAIAFISVFATLWIAIKLWHTHQREKLKTAAATQAAATQAAISQPAMPKPQEETAE